MARHSPERPPASPAPLTVSERAQPDFGQGLREPGEPPGTPAPPAERETRLAMLGYLTLPFFGFVVPLATYLAARRSPWLRGHAGQALNVWAAVFLYSLSAAIMGAILALDSVQAAVAVMLPVIVALWLVSLVFCVRAAVRASRGASDGIPGWLRTRRARKPAGPPGH